MGSSCGKKSAMDRRAWLHASALASVGWLPASACSSVAAHEGTESVITAVNRHQGTPTFFRHGKPYSKPVFETYAPLQQYFNQFADAGCDIFSFSVSFGLYGHSRFMWLAPGQWDFSPLDERVRQVLKAHPDGWIMPRIYLGTPDWWLDAHPDEVQILHDGSRVYPRTGQTPVPKNQPFASIASDRWRRDMAESLRKLVAHAESSEYRDHIFGYMVTGLATEEWYHWSSNADQLADYSSHMMTAFRQWLKDRYGTVEELRAAWRCENIEFESVQIPSKSARVGDRRQVFRDPRREMHVIDYYLFYNDIIPDTIDFFLGVAKRASNRRRVVGTFYGYQFEFNANPEFGHNALGRLLASPNLDFLMVTGSYYDRQLGSGADYMRSPMASVALHGKLWYHDNDTVGHLYWKRYPDPPDDQTLALGRQLGATSNVEETIWKHRRSAGFVLGNGAFQSFFDLHGGYFDDPQIMAEIRRLNRLLDDAKHSDRRSCAEILVVSDEASCAYATYDSGLLEQNQRLPQLSLAKIGAPHDSILLRDLERMDMRPYKLAIFLNPYFLTQADRQRIRERVATDGRTVFWATAPGIFGDHGERRETLSQLTGIDFSVALDEPPVPPLLVPGNSKHPLARALGGEHPPRAGLQMSCCPPIHVADDAVEILGLMAGSRAPGMVLKQLPESRSLISVTAALPPRFFRELARSAGAHIYLDRDDALYCSQSFLAISADGEGDRLIRLPQPCDVTEAISGARLATRSRHVRRKMQDKETAILRLVRHR